jgi:hypothetical protein
MLVVIDSECEYDIVGVGTIESEPVISVVGDRDIVGPRLQDLVVSLEADFVADCEKEVSEAV